MVLDGNRGGVSLKELKLLYICMPDIGLFLNSQKAGCRVAPKLPVNTVVEAEIVSTGGL